MGDLMRSIVDHALFYVHTKNDAPDDHPKTMRVEYYTSTGFAIFEWVCFEHKGHARAKAVAWWAARSKLPCPRSSAEAVRLADAGELAESLVIITKKKAGVRWPDLISVDLGPIPAPIPKPIPTPKRRCFYEILETEKGAGGEEIKRSFRKLAMRWHPDRNAGNPDAEARFREVVQAYEALRSR